MSDNVNKVLLVGTGPMAVEYVKVFRDLNIQPVIVGNTQKSVESFKEAIGEEAYIGGIKNYLAQENAVITDQAVIAVNGDQLFETTKLLVEAGVKNILVEKPGCLFLKDIELLLNLQKEHGTEIFVAYNRRFYESVNKAQEIIKADGGLVACNFEFTEWSHVIEKTKHPDNIKQKWFLMNSSHVVDLFIYFAGVPKNINSEISGGLSWHRAGSNYVGSGVTDKDVLFCYQAHWNAPGRWGLELLTKFHRLYLRPLEQLSVQDIASVKIESYMLDDELDVNYKAGLYSQVNDFINDNRNKLCTLQDQKEHMKIYEIISGEKY